MFGVASQSRPSGASRSFAGAQQAKWVRDVLDHVPHRDRVEGPLLLEAVEGTGGDLQARFACDGCRVVVQLDPFDLPAAGRGRGQEATSGAADVQKPSGLLGAGHEVEVVLRGQISGCGGPIGVSGQLRVEPGLEGVETCECLVIGWVPDVHELARRAPHQVVLPLAPENLGARGAAQRAVDRIHGPQGTSGHRAPQCR